MTKYVQSSTSWRYFYIKKASATVLLLCSAIYSLHQQIWLLCVLWYWKLIHRIALSWMTSLKLFESRNKKYVLLLQLYIGIMKDFGLKLSPKNQLDIYFLTLWEYWLGLAKPKNVFRSILSLHQSATFVTLWSPILSSQPCKVTICGRHKMFTGNRDHINKK